MKENNRHTGIDIIGDVPWGTHLCQFYTAKEDLIDILIPYIKAGLDNNECCIWITSEAFTEEEAKEAMRCALPDFDKYQKKGQMEFVSHADWYLRDGAFDRKRALEASIDRFEQALAEGYDGMRVTGDTAWLETKDWKSFSEYEQENGELISDYRIIAMCTYPLDKCGISEVIDVIRKHKFTLIKQGDEWKIIKRSEHRPSKVSKKGSGGEMRRVLKPSLYPISVVDLKEGIGKQKHATSDLYGLLLKDTMISERVLGLIAGTEQKKPTNPQKKPIKWNIAKSFKNAFMAAGDNKFPADLSGGAILASFKNQSPFTAIAKGPTERKLLEEQLVQSEKLVGIGMLASGIAHEINNPLTGIMGFAEIMMDENNPNLMRQYAEKIVNEAERVSDIVNWLSRYSRPAKDSNIKDVDLNEVINESLEALKHTQKSCDIVIEKNYQKIPSIKGNPSELLQIFVNLMSNAVDAMHDSGRLYLSTTMNDRYVVVKVSDDGIGIPRQDLNRIFEPFFTTKVKGNSTGLGLYVLSMLVKKHHGTVDVNSVVGKGTTFTLRFPISEEIT